MIPSLDYLRAASGGNSDMFAVASIDGNPPSFYELSAPRVLREVKAALA
jgi:hypothetical protein